jgi:hypothetical protein
LACETAAGKENRKNNPQLTMNMKPDGKPRIKATSVTLALALIAILYPSANTVRAQDASGLQQATTPGELDAGDHQQTVEEATSLLTSGKWRFHGVTRTFLPDGTFKSQNGNVGTWKLKEDQLEINMGTKKWRFFLPLDPKGTRGELEGHVKDKDDLLVKIPS